METTRRTLRYLVLTGLMVTVGCESISSDDDATVTGDDRSSQTTEDDSATEKASKHLDDDTAEPLEVTLPAPERDGLTAKFRQRVRTTRKAVPKIVRIGDEKTTLEPGVEEVFTIGADSQQLQRIEVDTVTGLMRIPPESTISINPDPCFDWVLGGPGLSPNTADSPDAVCVAEQRDCPDGMASPGPPRLARDPLCSEPLLESGDWKRCVSKATVVIDVETPTEYFTGPRGSGRIIEDRDTVAFIPPRCGYPRLVTPSEAIHLVAGVGAEWTIRVDEQGRISGIVDSGDDERPSEK